MQQNGNDNDDGNRILSTTITYTRTNSKVLYDMILLSFLYVIMCVWGNCGVELRSNNRQYNLHFQPST